ncbi:hypothetical protein ACVWY3_000210 [Bradyrhizobium sp. USDA 4486]
MQDHSSAKIVITAMTPAPVTHQQDSSKSVMKDLGEDLPGPDHTLGTGTAKPFAGWGIYEWGVPRG